MNILRGIFAGNKETVTTTLYEGELRPLVQPPGREQLDITTLDGYIIACALRGPDTLNRNPVTAHVLKQVFTMRVRALVGVDGTMVPVRTGPITRADVAALRALFLVVGAVDEVFNVSHFLNHAAKAAEALGARSLAELARITCSGIEYPNVTAASLDARSDEEIIKLAGGDSK